MANAGGLRVAVRRPAGTGRRGEDGRAGPSRREVRRGEDRGRRGVRAPRARVDHAPGVPEPARGSSAPGRRRALSEGRARLSHRPAEDADLLRRHPEVLPRPGGRVAPRARHDHRHERRRPGVRGRVHRVRIVDRGPRPVPRLPRAAGRPAPAHRGAGARGRREGQAGLSPHRRPPQRRDRAARDADGAGLPAGRGGIPAHHPDSRQRDCLDHAGRGA